MQRHENLTNSPFCFLSTIAAPRAVDHVQAIMTVLAMVTTVDLELVHWIVQVQAHQLKLQFQLLLLLVHQVLLQFRHQSAIVQMELQFVYRMLTALPFVLRVVDFVQAKGTVTEKEITATKWLGPVWLEVVNQQLQHLHQLLFQQPLPQLELPLSQQLLPQLELRHLVSVLTERLLVCQIVTVECKCKKKKKTSTAVVGSTAKT